jgi:hypothetical protein
MGDEEPSSFVNDLIKKGVLQKSKDPAPEPEPEPEPEPATSTSRPKQKQKEKQQKQKDGIYFHVQNKFSVYLLKIMNEEIVEISLLKRPGVKGSDYSSTNVSLDFIKKYNSIPDLKEVVYVCSFEERPLSDTRLYELFANEHTNLAKPEPTFTRVSRVPTAYGPPVPTYYGPPSTPTHYGAPSYPTPTLTGSPLEIDPPRYSVFGTPQPSDYPPPPDPRKRGRRPERH